MFKKFKSMLNPYKEVKEKLDNLHRLTLCGTVEVEVVSRLFEIDEQIKKNGS